MIKQDSVSILFFAVACAELAFAFVSPETLQETDAFGLLVAFMLLILGLVGWLVFLALEKTPPTEAVDTMTSPDKTAQLMVGVLVAVVLFVLSNKFIPQIAAATSGIEVITFFGTFTLATASVADQVSNFLFSVVLIPVAEENFFRGFFANLLTGGQSTGWAAGLGVVLQALVFMLFHVPAYGWTPDLVIILADGLVIGAVDVGTERLSPGIVAHVLNNFLAWAVVTGAITVGGHGLVETLPVSLCVMVVSRKLKGLSAVPGVAFK